MMSDQDTDPTPDTMRRNGMFQTGEWFNAKDLLGPSSGGTRAMLIGTLFDKRSVKRPGKVMAGVFIVLMPGQDQPAYFLAAGDMANETGRFHTCRSTEGEVVGQVHVTLQDAILECQALQAHALAQAHARGEAVDIGPLDAGPYDYVIPWNRKIHGADRPRAQGFCIERAPLPVNGGLGKPDGQ